MRMLAVPQPWRAVHAVAASQVEALRRIIMRLWATPFPGLEEALAEGRPGPALMVIEAALHPAEAEAAKQVANVFMKCIVGAGEATWRTGMTPRNYTPRLRTAEAGDRSGALTISFDRTSPEALAWSKANAGNLVTSCNNRDAIRKIIVGGFADQKPPRVIAKDIRMVIGLSDPQYAKWSKMTDFKEKAKYAVKANRQRALLIARTETMRASNEGQMEAWRQGVKTGLLKGSENRVWITTYDDRTCPTCAPMDGVIIVLRGSFQLPTVGKSAGGVVRMPPAHPACRCAMGLTEKPTTQPQTGVVEGEDWTAPPPSAPSMPTSIPGAVTTPKAPKIPRPSTLTKADAVIEDAMDMRAFTGLRDEATWRDRKEYALRFQVTDKVEKDRLDYMAEKSKEFVEGGAEVYAKA